MNKFSLLELKSSSIVYREKCNGFFNNRIKREIFEYHQLQEIKVSLKNRKVFLIIHGENIYVENIELPKMKKVNVYYSIEEKLKRKFKNIDNIMFYYKIVHSNRSSINVMVFCINWNENGFIENLHKKNIHIKGIIPIQLYALQCFKKRIKRDKYIFSAFFEKKGYFMACYKSEIIFQDIFNISCKDDILYSLDEFELKLKLFVPSMEFTNVEFLNLPYKNLMKELSLKYNCSDLGEMKI